MEANGWKGALLGTGWGRPDTLTVAAALAARTRTFEPLIAIRPGCWRPANFASAAATLDHLTGGRVRVLGRTARRRPGTDRTAARAQCRTGSRARPAGIRAADHHLRP
ncbi:LLM class flavin-dependent oxidoreductase [Nocardia sp. NPDC050718]|uniref:LLM class flavin-dependent oxidoreductase n=1 Tax=Nocardia sp. NPDC050718 TaxID=3155788 RepID=UPI0033DF87CE